MMVSFEQRVSNARGALLRRWLLCPALSAALLAPLASSSGCSNAATGHGTGGGAAFETISAKGGASPGAGGALAAGGLGASGLGATGSGASGLGASGGGPATASGGGLNGAAGRPSTTSGGTSGAGAPGSAGSSSAGSASTGTAAAIAKRLGRQPNFLIGMGNDLADNHDKDGAYTLGVTLDLHYAYLVGLLGNGGWPDWNEGGTFVNVLTDTAKSHGVTPMFSLYAMAANGENNMSALVDDAYMKPYWDGLTLLYKRIAAFGGPALVQFEPDFWGYAQQASNSKPATLKVHVASLAPDCAALGDNLVGLGKCMVLLGHKYAPKAVLAFHVSHWADSDPVKIAKFIVDVGGGDADLVTTDTLDRDAGCFEAHTDPGCQRDDGPWYWDETNTKSPNFHEHLAWVKAITLGTGKPMLWWQTPLGTASTTSGGSAGHYRDNRVKYLFSHVGEFVAAGGIGAVFGVGADNQTYISTDGGQFKDAAAKYLAAPVPLP